MVGPLADAESAPGRPGVSPDLMRAISVPASRRAFSGDHSRWLPMVTRRDFLARGVDPEAEAGQVLVPEDDLAVGDGQPLDGLPGEGELVHASHGVSPCGSSDSRMLSPTSPATVAEESRTESRARWA